MNVLFFFWETGSLRRLDLHAASGEGNSIAVGAAAAEAGALGVLARRGRVPRVRHVRAVHGPLAVPAYHPGVGVLDTGLGPVFGQVFVVCMKLWPISDWCKFK